ncbi:hypothetical protein IQ258_29385 [Coleofasciculus sp. LEGE 07081]|uniref:hypothetical protein n=1 Tax=Coleofasciculus sp. LEGE 07081 TaxID=2777967 RepID=UPI00187F2B32|nr:hypothetical protein [Coleofasciculus sp. LEGE 07081]MBE9130133.1 hypothetical protein [Coleofasciculus sp. LEGE 07081]
MLWRKFFDHYPGSFISFLASSAMIVLATAEVVRSEFFATQTYFREAQVFIPLTSLFLISGIADVYQILQQKIKKLPPMLFDLTGTWAGAVPIFFIFMGTGFMEVTFLGLTRSFWFSTFMLLIGCGVHALSYKKIKFEFNTIESAAMSN